MLQQPLGSGHWGLAWRLNKQSSRKGSSSSLVPCLPVPTSPSLPQASERIEPSSPGSSVEALPCHLQGPFWSWPCWHGLFWPTKVQEGVGGHQGQCRVGEVGLGLAVPTDNPSPQNHARTAALRVSTPTGSVSVMSSALTTRAAAPTTWLSASAKVRSEWVGGPGIPSAAGDSPPPTLLAVTRGDVFTLPEDEYGNLDYHEETSVYAQSESSTLSSHLQTQIRGGR